MMGIGALGSLGESMSVVIEKRLSELQEEYDKVKATWFGPEEFNKIKKQLDEESQAKQTLEVHFHCNFGLFQVDRNRRDFGTDHIGEQSCQCLCCSVLTRI